MRHSWLRKGYLRLLMALSLMVVLQGLYAQTWTWQQRCIGNNEWYAYCIGGICGGFPSFDTLYRNNWGQSYCGSPSGLRFPEVGSSVIFPTNSNARLTQNCDVKSITLESGSTFTWQGGTLTLRDPSNNNTPGVFLNRGTVSIEPIQSCTLSGTFINESVLRYLDGTLYLNGATIQNYGLIVAEQGRITTVASTWNEYMIKNFATLRKQGTGSLTIQVPVEQQNAYVQVLEGSLLLQTSSKFGNTNWLVNHGANLHIQSGINYFLGNHVGEINGSLLNSARILLMGSSAVVFNFGGNGFTWVSGEIYQHYVPLRNDGLIRTVPGHDRVLAASLFNAGTFHHQGGTILTENAEITNLENGTLLLDSGNFRNRASRFLRIINFGVIRKTTQGSSYVEALPLRNFSLVDCQGELHVPQLEQVQGETRIHYGATLTVDDPIALFGGVLMGSGTLRRGSLGLGGIRATGGVIAPGIVDPANPQLNPVGIFTILDGNLIIGTNATLEIDLSGTDNSNHGNPMYDQLRVVPMWNRTLTVQLNGTLRLKGRNGFTPSVGDSFDIILNPINNWNLSGTFSRVEVDPHTLPCMEVAVHYTPNRVWVEVVRTSGINPDLNNDGCVDDADLLNVLFAFGQTGSSPADVNCDGIVDDADLLSVLFAFGQGC